MTSKLCSYHKKSLKGGRTVLLSGVLLFLSGALCAAETTISVGAGPYEISTDAKGSSINMSGFLKLGSSGDPQLLMKTYDIVLPPDADPASVSVTVSGVVSEELGKAYDITPADPAVTYVDGKAVTSWGSGKNIKDGRNLNVYGVNAKFPPEAGALDTVSQMRKWKFARVSFYPVQYNPVTGKVYMIKSAQLTVSARMAPAALSSAAIEQRTQLLSDTVMDGEAGGRFYNFDQAKGWYSAPASSVARARGAGTYDYAIITTNAIVAGSTKLASFITQLQALNHTVLTVTETDYGALAGQAPNGTAEKIRKWLKDNYVAKGIRYVLLIGDPTPTTGDVPMKMCWPRRDQSSEREAPTDYFYSNLSGNWDLNGNSFYGEYVGDKGTGGVDFTAEVYVGRIPVYSANYTVLDSILQKIIDYKNTSGEPAWKKKALLPMAISNYANENYDSSKRSDGQDLPKYAIDNYLTGYGFSNYVMYEKAGLTPVASTAPYDNASHIGVTEANMLSEWNNGYGVVLWWGHGSENSVSRKYWAQDTAGTGVPMASDMSWPDMFSSTTAVSLGNTRPSFVFQVSCNNGYPERTDNLGYALLKNGAIATVSASRVSWYAVGTWDPTLFSYGDNASTGYSFFQNLLSTAASVSAGQALFDTKANKMGDSWSGSSWMNKMDFNLYGDPSISMFSGALSPLAPTLMASSADSLSVSWNTVAGASYVVALSTNSDFTGIVSGSSGPVTGANSVTFTGLEYSTNYWFEMKLSTESDSAYYFNRVALQTTTRSGVSLARAYPIPWRQGAGGKFDSATVAGCGTGLIFDRLPSSGTIRIYNIRGDLVRELSVDAADSGCKAWDGKNGAGREVASGIYLAYMSSSEGSRTLKLVVER